MDVKDIKNAKIAIYGAGAMGITLGAFLTEGGLGNVELINRNVEYVEDLRQEGARIDLGVDAGKQTRTVKVRIGFPEEMQGKYDVIFLMTKQRHNTEIVEYLSTYLHEDGIICTTQNGLPEESVAAVIGKERTYGAVMSFGAGFVVGEKARVKLTSKLSAMHVEVGGYRNDGAKLPLLKEILSYGAKVTNENFVTVTDNLLGARWLKLSINAAFSGLSAMTGLPFGEIVSRHKTRKLAIEILRECATVATAQGVILPKMHGFDLAKMLCEKSTMNTFIAYMVLPFAMRKHKLIRSGMLLDIAKGRKCEIDFINGIVCKEGKKIGVETPICEQIVEIVHGIENGLYEMDYRNVDFFEV
jgi:2-dehydropantoate 2-reductase